MTRLLSLVGWTRSTISPARPATRNVVSGRQASIGPARGDRAHNVQQLGRRPRQISERRAEHLGSEGVRAHVVVDRCLDVFATVDGAPLALVLMEQRDHLDEGEEPEMIAARAEPVMRELDSPANGITTSTVASSRCAFW